MKKILKLEILASPEHFPFLLDPILKKLSHFGIELHKFYWDQLNTPHPSMYGQLDASLLKW